MISKIKIKSDFRELFVNPIYIPERVTVGRQKVKMNCNVVLITHQF